MKHLDEINETYWQHFKFAIRVGLVLVIAGVLVMVHALFPNILKNVGSDVITHAYNILNERKNPAPERPFEQPPAPPPDRVIKEGEIPVIELYEPDLDDD